MCCVQAIYTATLCLLMLIISMECGDEDANYNTPVNISSIINIPTDHIIETGPRNWHSVTIVPAPALIYDAGCSLTKRYCKLKNAWGCTSWGESRWIVATGCEYNGVCSDKYGNCTTHWTNVGTWGYDDFECVCNSSGVEFGEPRKDSKVDLREKQNVFWELAVPPAYENAELLCKPGNTEFVNSNVSQKESHFDFLCKNSIAYFSDTENSTREETWITFDLGDGNDEVYLGNDKQFKVATFEMGSDGHKIFHGGQGLNQFSFSNCNGSLTGELVGGNGRNVINIRECLYGKEVNLNIMKDVNTLTVGENVSIVFRKIKHISFDGLWLDFDGSENWNVTLNLTALPPYHNQDYMESNRASDIMSALCGSENINISLKNGIVCSTWWARVMIWITLVSICVSFSLLVCIVTNVCVKWKTENNVSDLT